MHLSLVATSRNDDHGGNLLSRMQLFVDGWVEQCVRHRLSAELILVEWNPPANRPRLKDTLRWPTGTGIRIIEVSNEIHRRLKHSDQLPLFQMIAKNVGIRRAKGKFILASNIDILFSDELMHFLASDRLKRGRMYRINRYDVPMPEGETMEARLRYCREHVIRISEREGTRNLISGHYHVVYNALNWKQRLHQQMQDWDLYPVDSYSRLHTNTCGDFTLMAKEHWFAVRGYPELEMYSFHLDSVLCHAAHHAGAREQVFDDPMRIYHIEHAAGSGWTPEGAGKLKDRLAEGGVPQLSHDQFAAWATQMRRERCPILFNKEDWGFANEPFRETSL